MARHFPVFSPVAEHGLMVEFGDLIAPATRAAVRALDIALAESPFDGFIEAVPAYASLLVRFDPLRSDHGLAEAHLRRLMRHPEPAGQGRILREVAVCYDHDLAPDLAMVAQACGLTPDAVVAAHLTGRYDVAMYGFAPGYAYLSGVPDEIRLPRKPVAARGIPAGSVLIAGQQCLVSTLVMPTGWWVIGRSPTRILTGDTARPFLFDVGDQVRFHRIDRAAFDALAAG